MLLLTSLLNLLASRKFFITFDIRMDRRKFLEHGVSKSTVKADTELVIQVKMAHHFKTIFNPKTDIFLSSIYAPQQNNVTFQTAHIANHPIRFD